MAKTETYKQGPSRASSARGRKEPGGPTEGERTREAPLKEDAELKVGRAAAVRHQRWLPLRSQRPEEGWSRKQGLPSKPVLRGVASSGNKEVPMNRKKRKDCFTNGRQMQRCRMEGARGTMAERRDTEGQGWSVWDERAGTGAWGGACAPQLRRPLHSTLGSPPLTFPLWILELLSSASSSSLVASWDLPSAFTIKHGFPWATPPPTTLPWRSLANCPLILAITGWRERARAGSCPPPPHHLSFLEAHTTHIYSSLPQFSLWSSTKPRSCAHLALMTSVPASPFAYLISNSSIR